MGILESKEELVKGDPRFDYTPDPQNPSVNGNREETNRPATSTRRLDNQDFEEEKIGYK